MIPGEEFYPALSRLTQYPEWKVFEQFIEWRIKKVFDEFLGAGPDDLLKLQVQASELFAIKKMVKDLIEEVEASHKLRR